MFENTFGENVLSQKCNCCNPKIVHEVGILSLSDFVRERLRQKVFRSPSEGEGSFHPAADFQSFSQLLLVPGPVLRGGRGLSIPTDFPVHSAQVTGIFNKIESQTLRNEFVAWLLCHLHCQ